jgi:protein-S-isoprenylcysteine O-methyltransferase Ste14
MNTFKKWQDQESPLRKHLLFLALGALIFPTLIPAFLVFLLPRVDKSLGIGSFYAGVGNIVIGVLTILIGGFLAFWTIIAQIKLASGTPFPMLPTKRLLVIGPFKYCRNPMTLGTVIAYSGVAVWVGSYTALFAVFLFASLLLVYLKLIEEKELEMRFGPEYVDYKKNTPFILPIRFKKVAQDHQ